MQSMLSIRNLLLPSVVVATSNCLSRDWCLSVQCRQYPNQWLTVQTLQSQHNRIFMRKALMQNNKPFSNEWFAPFVAIKPTVHNTDDQQYPPGYEGPELILASGCIVDSSGLIVSACDRLSISSYVKIRLNDGSTHEARVVDLNPETGLSVIQLDGMRNDWPVIDMADSSVDYELGDIIYTVGNWQPTHYNLLHDGVVVRTDLKPNAVDDDITVPLVQHTAVVKENDNGNAIVDSNGQVMAINIKALKCEINAAVPIHVVKSYVDSVKQKLLQNYGLSVYWYDPNDRQEFIDCGISPNLLPDYKGILVYSINSEILLDTNDIQVYDVITHINGKRVDSMDDLYCALLTQTIIKVWVNYPYYEPIDDESITLVKSPNEYSDRFYL
ncbi:uncharacterized protein LOC128955871 [Oppia nitens]|uniref:uncharacterized protein LOC128955871 n=1 Tax=Oppia nitens TaxID=1686743 RepID=UPI0023DA549E|nr:uncharacterized protein LOC128955871 [Oppia nitens]